MARLQSDCWQKRVKRTIAEVSSRSKSCYRARKYIGACLAAMNGADAVVFTGGIGENSPEMRARICGGLQWIGVEVDEELNRSHTSGREGLISKDGSRPAVYVIPTDEELLAVAQRSLETGNRCRFAASIFGEEKHETVKNNGAAGEELLNQSAGRH